MIPKAYRGAPYARIGSPLADLKLLNALQHTEQEWGRLICQSYRLRFNVRTDP